MSYSTHSHDSRGHRRIAMVIYSRLFFIFFFIKTLDKNLPTIEKMMPYFVVVVLTCCMIHDDSQ